MQTGIFEFVGGPRRCRRSAPRRLGLLASAAAGFLLALGSGSALAVPTVFTTGSSASAGAVGSAVIVDHPESAPPATPQAGNAGRVVVGGGGDPSASKLSGQSDVVSSSPAPVEHPSVPASTPSRVVDTTGIVLVTPVSRAAHRLARHAGPSAVRRSRPRQPQLAVRAAAPGLGIATAPVIDTSARVRAVAHDGARAPISHAPSHPTSSAPPPPAQPPIAPHSPIPSVPVAFAAAAGLARAGIVSVDLLALLAALALAAQLARGRALQDDYLGLRSIFLVSALDRPG
jgi:hypothetical protein